MICRTLRRALPLLLLGALLAPAICPACATQSCERWTVSEEHCASMEAGTEGAEPAHHGGMATTAAPGCERFLVTDATCCGLAAPPLAAASASLGRELGPQGPAALSLDAPPGLTTAPDARVEATESPPPAASRPIYTLWSTLLI